MKKKLTATVDKWRGTVTLSRPRTGRERLVVEVDGNRITVTVNGRTIPHRRKP